ncbi:MAG: hypothetical protein ACJAVK_003401 [Akkermansiaceae bacterium]|jgi:hypothetical protein
METREGTRAFQGSVGKKRLNWDFSGTGTISKKLRGKIKEESGQILHSLRAEKYDELRR